jgi:hypothetical protein
MLKPLVDFATMLIGEEGARLLREKRVKGDPAGASSAEEAPGPPAESEPLERKSTCKFNIAIVLNKRERKWTVLKEFEIF